MHSALVLQRAFALSRLGSALRGCLLPATASINIDFVRRRRLRFASSTSVSSSSPVAESAAPIDAHNIKYLAAATPLAPHDSNIFQTVLVDTLDALERARAEVVASARIGVDTEFVKLSNYQPSLELVQLATSQGTIYVVDCRAIEMLRRGALVELLRAVVSRPLVFHAADEDLRLLYAWSAQAPVSIFDTQLAAKCAGIGPLDGGVIGYGALVKSIVGVELDKSQTLTDWRLRPLTMRQILYAANDVKYLFSLQDNLVQQLSAANRIAWLPTLVDPMFDTTRFAPKDPLAAWKTVTRRNKIQGQGILIECVFRELAAWRERLAVRSNTQPSAVIRDDLLISVAQQTALHIHETSAPVVENAGSTAPAAVATSAASTMSFRSPSPSNDALVAFDTAPVGVMVTASVSASASAPPPVTHLREPVKLIHSLRRIQGIKAPVLDRNTNSLVAAIQKGIECAAAFRASPLAAGLCLNEHGVSSTGANYQPALSQYFDDMLPGSVKSVVAQSAVSASPVVSGGSSGGSGGLASLLSFWIKSKADALAIPHALLLHGFEAPVALANFDSHPAFSTSRLCDVLGSDLVKLKNGSAALVWNSKSNCVELRDL